MNTADETAISEIEIGPDGRVYVFGASRQILEVLNSLQFDDQQLRNRLDAMMRAEESPESQQTQASTPNE